MTVRGSDRDSETKRATIGRHRKLRWKWEGPRTQLEDDGQWGEKEVDGGGEVRPEQVDEPGQRRETGQGETG